MQDILSPYSTYLSSDFDRLREINCSDCSWWVHMQHKTIEQVVEWTSIVNYSNEEDHTCDWLVERSRHNRITYSMSSRLVTIFLDNVIHRLKHINISPCRGSNNKTKLANAIDKNLHYSVSKNWNIWLVCNENSSRNR